MTHWYIRDDTSTGKSYICLEATRNVPEDYTVIKHGVLFTTNPTVGTEETLVLNGGSDVREVWANQNTNQGVHTTDFNMTDQLDKTIYARGYMVVKKGDELVNYYTAVVNGSYNSIANQP